MKFLRPILDGCLAVITGGWIFWIIFGVPVAQREAGAWAQKIFYIHVPTANASFLGFLIVSIIALMCLAGDTDYWGARLRPAVEVSFLFSTLVLLTGPLWARPVWGTWWRWEPRLTTFFILWLMYGGWFLLRMEMEPGHRRTLYTSIYALVAFVNVPLVMVSVYFWRPEQQQHPMEIELDFSMEMMLYASFVLLIILLLRIMWLRFSLEKVIHRIQEQEQRLLTPDTNGGEPVAGSDNS